MYEKATAIPLMTAVHREANLIMHERNIRLDEIRDQLRALARTRENFWRIKELRHEQLRLLGQF